MADISGEACGGTTYVNNNPDAPKSITSKELVDLSISFNHTMRGMLNMDEDMQEAALAIPEGCYSYTVKRNDAENFTLTKNRQEYPINPMGLQMLAAVISTHNIAEQNGNCSWTHGLANVPYYCFNASYASGEVIQTECCPGLPLFFFPVVQFLESYIAKQEPLNKPAPPPKGVAWNCLCGQKALRVKFCGECGARSPLNQDGSWNCQCGTKNLIVKFCPECGQKNPRVEY